MAHIVIFGTGDIARLAHYYLTEDSEHDVVAFTVDAGYHTGESFLDRPVVPFEQVRTAFPPGQHCMFIALSYARMNVLREERYTQAKALGYDLVSYVSSHCTYLSRHRPGDNCFILEDNTVQPFVRIGANVTLWSGNHIGHDSSIGDHCFISSHVVVSGHVEIGHHSFVGVNATIRNNVKIAEHTLIGAGALVMKDTRPRSVYVATRTDRFRKTSDQVEL